MTHMHQLNFDRAKNIAELNLNPFFYPPRTIKHAAKAFEGVCSVKQTRFKERLLVSLKIAKGFDAELVALSFANYALALRREMR